LLVFFAQFFCAGSRECDDENLTFSTTSASSIFFFFFEGIGVRAGRAYLDKISEATTKSPNLGMILYFSKVWISPGH